MQGKIDLDEGSAIYVKITSSKGCRSARQQRASYQTDKGYVELIIDFSEDGKALGIEILDEIYG